MVKNDDTSASLSAGDLNGSFDDLTNREILKLIMDEIMCVRNGLKEDVSNLGKNLRKEMRDGFKKVNKRIDNLNFKVDQNCMCFMTNLDSIDKRVTKLETAAV